MMLAWDNRQDRDIALRSAKFRPHSPNVTPLSVEELKAMNKRREDWRKYIPKSQEGGR